LFVPIKNLFNIPFVLAAEQFVRANFQNFVIVIRGGLSPVIGAGSVAFVCDHGLDVHERGVVLCFYGNAGGRELIDNFLLVGKRFELPFVHNALDVQAAVLGAEQGIGNVGARESVYSKVNEPVRVLDGGYDLFVGLDVAVVVDAYGACRAVAVGIPQLVAEADKGNDDNKIGSFAGFGHGHIIADDRSRKVKNVL